jgi:PST family polysaccharide transporter
MGVGMIVGVWIARYLGPGQFGLLNFAAALIGMFGAVAGMGLQGIVVRDIVRNPNCTNEILGTAATLQLIGGIVAYVLIQILISYLRPNDDIARIVVSILSSIMLLEASKIAVFWFESQLQSKYSVWVQNTAFIIFAAVKVLLILKESQLMSFVWATLVEAILVALILIYVLARKGPAVKEMRVSVARAKNLLKDSWPMMLSGIAIMIYMKIDQIMLAQMIGDEAVGIYSAATRISEVWYFMPVAIVASVFPAILEAKKRSEEEYYEKLQKLFDSMVMMSIAVAVPMTFLSTPFISLFFGDSYRDSGPVLAVHIWAAVFVFLGVASSKWLLAENRQILSLQRTALGAAANIALNLLWIPTHGPLGAALATVVSYAIAAFFSDLIQKETRKIFLMKVDALNPLALYRRYL